MNVLWIVNILFPEAVRLLTNKGELRSSGGWMLGAAEALLNSSKEISLTVATVSPLVQQLTLVQGNQITYYVLPFGKGNANPNKEYESYWKEIYDQLQPDVVHIHGTEYSHGLAFLNACPDAKSVISIQGLTSAYYYYYSGLTKFQIIKNLTLMDFLFGTIFAGKRSFKQRGETIEKPMLRKINHIIGRTSWDKAHAWTINPNAQYHFCNETLRSEFYDGSKWDYDKCEKHTIFLSQAGYPIKGLHQVLRAMPLILRHYPNTKIKVAGFDITRNDSLRDKIRLSGYGKIIRQMINHLHLEKHIEFLGPLNADEMKQEYINCNVFVIPSSIENSPNSLGETQLLGVPCIVSYVGGVHDMVPTPECGDLYRFEEFEMLAYKVCQMFETSKSFDNTTMRGVASERHDPKRNAKTLYGIYTKILKK